NIEVATGLAATTGYDAQTPYRTGSFVADPIGGTQAALGIIAAIELAERTGTGAHLDISLVEATLPFMVYSFARLHTTGAPMVPSGNADEWDTPAGAYPAAGPDEWIALAVRDDEQWAALAAAAGLDPALGSTRAARLANRELIDKALRDWTSALTQYDAVRVLQRAGVPAAPILKNYPFHSDPHLVARSAFIPVEHPETGVLPYPGFPWRLAATPASVRSAAPCFAEGNDYVFGRLLGLGGDEIAALYAEGISSLTPSGLDPVLPNPAKERSSMESYRDIGARLSNWNRWGPEDERGTVNFITPDKLVSAARLIRTGKVFDLGIPFGADGPQPGGGRVNPVHLMRETGENQDFPGGFHFADDYIFMPLQSASQWDGLSHVFYDGHLYNGYSSAHVDSHGAKKLSIDKMGKGIAGRGVLLDIARLKGVDHMQAGEVITPEDLDQAMAAQGVQVGTGDILLIRTGWRNVFTSSGDARAFMSGEPGIGLACCEWLDSRE